MIEKIVLDYLTAELSPIPVVMEEEKDKPSKFVLIERTGGGEVDHINSATIAIQSYDESLYKAAQLNELVKSKMENIISLPNVSACHLNSDYNYTDTTEKRYRYQAVFDIYY